MALAQERTYTIDDIYALPDGQRAELIDGHMYMTAPPNRIHQKLVNRLSQTITNYIDSKHGSCEVYPAPFAVFLHKDDKTYVEPDISIICDSSKLYCAPVKFAVQPDCRPPARYFPGGITVNPGGLQYR